MLLGQGVRKIRRHPFFGPPGVTNKYFFSSSDLILFSCRKIISAASGEILRPHRTVCASGNTRSQLSIRIAHWSSLDHLPFFRFGCILCTGKSKLYWRINVSSIKTWGTYEKQHINNSSKKTRDSPHRDGRIVWILMFRDSPTAQRWLLRSKVQRITALHLPSGSSTRCLFCKEWLS